MKQFLMVRTSDQFIQGTFLQDDPEAGPVLPQDLPPTGMQLVEYAGHFTRTGRRNTEIAYWRDGAVEWVETASVEQLRDAAITAIDAAGEALRLAVVNRMPMQSEEYRRVESQARAWAAAGYPEDAAPRSVTSWAKAKHRDGWTDRQACDDILATANAWYDVLDTIRELRLAKKEDVRHAQPDEITAIRASMDDAMAAMAQQLNLTLTE